MAACADAVEDVGLEHGVVADAGEIDPVPGQEAARLFEILSRLDHPGIFQQRLRSFENLAPGELLSNAEIVVADGNVGRIPRFDSERHTHRRGVHEPRSGDLDRERHLAGVLRPRQQGVETVAVADDGDLQRFRCRRLCRAPTKLLEPRFEFVAFEILPQLGFVGQLWIEIRDT